MNTTNISITKLHPFEGHPYKVLDNEDMSALIESVKSNGILTPLIVRPIEDSDEFEVISGHRRLYAATKAGLETVPAFIHPVDRAAAAVELVDSNLHRDHILPSEKAFAYKLKMEALAHQGSSRQVGEKWSVAKISEAAKESERQIHRYIRLTHLIPSLLDMVDQGRIAFSIGVELSYLPEKAQNHLAELIERDEATPSYSQAVRLHKEENESYPSISFRCIDEIMAEKKPNQREQIRLNREEFRDFFPEHYSEAEIKRDIAAGLDLLHRQRMRNREAR